MTPIRLYDRFVARLSRRDLLKIAGTAGLSALAQPVAAFQSFTRPVFREYPFQLGVASDNDDRRRRTSRVLGGAR